MGKTVTITNRGKAPVGVLSVAGSVWIARDDAKTFEVSDEVASSIEKGELGDKVEFVFQGAAPAIPVPRPPAKTAK